MTDLLLSRRARGRPSPTAETAYQERRQAFCALIREIRSTMDFAVGVRGWCYILEGRGHITKGEFDACENFITDCRKTGDLPLDICAEDDSRTTIGLQREPDESDPRDHAQGWIDYLREDMPNSYRPFGFWDDQKVYVEVADLRRVLRPKRQSERLVGPQRARRDDEAIRRARARRTPMRAAVVQRPRSGQAAHQRIDAEQPRRSVRPSRPGRRAI